MVGVWEKGSMMGQGELTDFKGNVYTGDIVDGRPHGHGTKRMGKFDASKFYIGAWERGVKHGYGVMEENGEKYLGLWKDDVRQGPGCVVNVDGIFYQGNFLNNKLMGTGIMVFDDGAKYEGEFSGFGKFSGKGVLYTDNRKYEGTFSGNYSDSMKFNGEITILKNPADCDVVKPKFIIPHDDKWREIFDKWNRQVGADPSKVWTKIAFVIGATKSPEQIKDCLGIFPKAGQAEPLIFEDLEFIENYLKEAFQSKLHPFGTLLNHLVDAYRASYEGIKTNSNNFLLQHALMELFSIMHRVYAIVRTMFPALPEDHPHNTNSFSVTSVQEQTKVITPRGLMMSLLMPKLHPTLYVLFKMREEKSDEKYQLRVDRWNKHDDNTLLTFLLVDPKLIMEEENAFKNRNKHFLAAITSLQIISDLNTPDEKLGVITAMYQDICSASDAVVWSMDALLPVTMYVVVRARVPQLGAELAELDELMEPHLCQGEKGIMLITLQAAYEQMKKESPDIDSVVEQMKNVCLI